MKKIILIAAFLLFIPALSKAELFHYRDSDGALHIVDSPHKIPAEFQEGAESREFETPPAATVKKSAKGIAPTVRPPKKGPELFGGHPVEWWVREIKNRGKEISATKLSISEKKRFISIFEGGRRLGQIFTSEDVATYNKHKNGLPAEESKLGSLVEKLEAFKRRAKRAGVPKGARG